MIFRYSEKLYEDLNNALGALKLEEKSILKSLEHSAQICAQYFSRLRDFYKEHPLKEPAEQIQFFKEVKPRFKSLLIFHQQALNIESRRPIGDKAALAAYYLDEIRMLAHEFESNLAFYQYVRSGSAYLDDRYFIPGVYEVLLDPDESMLDGDAAFTTSHDHKVARIMAGELLLTYLEKNILRLNQKEDVDLTAFIEEEMITWTQTNTALAELIYGLKESKALNHGKLSIARITAYLQKVFHAEVGNISDTWNYICGRANRTIFLDEMKKAVLERMAAKFK